MTTSPSTAAASSGTDTWSPSSSTRPMSRSASRTVAALVTPSITWPSTARWMVFCVETRSTRASSRSEREADKRTLSRSPSPSTASPTVRAVVQICCCWPSMSRVSSRLWRTTTSPPAAIGDACSGATTSSGPTLTWAAASTSATVRPNASTCTVVPSTSTSTRLWSTANAVVDAATSASTSAWAVTRASRPTARRCARGGTACVTLVLPSAVPSRWWRASRPTWTAFPVSSAGERSPSTRAGTHTRTDRNGSVTNCETRHQGPYTSCAVAARRSHTSARSRPCVWAIIRTVPGSRYGALGRPRWGCTVR